MPQDTDPATNDAPAIAILPAHLSVGVPVAALAAEALPGPAFLPPFPAALPIALGLALIAAAGLITHAASRTFSDAKTNIDPRAPALALAETGPYRFSRNPMYLSMILLQAGVYLALSLDTGLLLLPVLWAALHFGVVKREEAYLSTKFGAPYRAYLSRTRRWL